MSDETRQPQESATIRHKVLLVDDEDGILKALKRLLRSLEVEILTAPGGEEALALLAENDVSLIISDQRMPNMTGVEFLSKSREVTPDAVRILLTGYADLEATVAAINSGAVRYYLNKPWDDNDLVSRISESLDLYAMASENRRLHATTKQQNEQLRELNTSLDRRVAEQTAQIQQQNVELRKSFMETIKAFSTVVELRFKDISGHSQRVAKLVKRLLPKTESDHKEHQNIQDIIVAAFLHDMGKISLPDKVLSRKPEHYSQTDTEEVQRHPVLGQSCLYHIDGFSKIGLAIRHHHENYDGTGYPDGLRGKQIPLGSRLIRLADAFDNFAFAEGYPSRERVNEASALLVRGSGTLFDPELVRRFISLDVMQEFEFDDSGETALVPPYDLREGMVVAEDVHTKNGMFLLPRGAKLSRGMINRIMKINNADPVPAGIQVFKASKPKKEKARHETVQDIISG